MGYFKANDRYGITKFSGRFYSQRDGEAHTQDEFFFKKECIPNMLLEHLNFIDKKYVHQADYCGNTALHMILEAPLTLGYTPMNAIERIIQDGADVDCPNFILHTPMHIAALSGQLITLNYLLTLKPNITATNYKGRNILHLLCYPPSSEKLFFGTYYEYNYPELFHYDCKIQRRVDGYYFEQRKLCDNELLLDGPNSMIKSIKQLLNKQTEKTRKSLLLKSDFNKIHYFMHAKNKRLFNIYA
jgi:hypothetical protein